MLCHLSTPCWQGPIQVLPANNYEVSSKKYVHKWHGIWNLPCGRLFFTPWGPTCGLWEWGPWLLTTQSASATSQFRRRWEGLQICRGIGIGKLQIFLDKKSSIWLHLLFRNPILLFSSTTLKSHMIANSRPPATQYLEDQCYAIINHPWLVNWPIHSSNDWFGQIHLGWTLDIKNKQS